MFFQNLYTDMYHHSYFRNCYLTFFALKYVFESVEDGVIPSFRIANTTFIAASGLCARPHLVGER